MLRRALALAAYLLLTLAAAVMLMPLVWLLAAASKEPGDMFSYLFFSPRPGLYNFRQLFSKIEFFQFFLNSVFIASTTAIGQLFFSSLGGFALARYRFRGQRLIMILMLGMLMIPSQVLLAPLYEMIYRLGLMDSYLGLLLPTAVSVFGTFLFRQAMLQIPDDLLQAGRMDGCSEFQIYWHIAVPLVKPMVGAFCLVSFLGAWNSFLWPQLVLHSQDRLTLPVALNQMVGIYSQDYGTLMAGTLLSILPVMIFFFVFQRSFIRGLTAGAVKG